MYFLEGGEYKFNPHKLKDAHNWFQNQVRMSMKNSNKTIGDLRIAVSNTFTQEWEMKPYFEMAEEYGFKVFTIIIENRHGGSNEHNVPDDKIELMKNRFDIKL